MENQKKLTNLINPDNAKKSMSKYLFMGMSMLVVVVAVGLLVVLIPGEIEKINNNNSEISGLQAETSEMERAIGVLNSVSSSEIKSSLGLAETALPSEKSVAGLISGLTNLASSSGTEVSEIDVAFGQVSTSSATTDVKNQQNDVKLDNDVVGIPIKMEVEGSEAQLLELIAKIQGAMPLLGTQTMEYTISDTANSGSLLVLVYSQPAAKFNRNKLGEIVALTNKEMEALGRLPTRTNILQ